MDTTLGRILVHLEDRPFAGGYSLGKKSHLEIIRRGLSQEELSFDNSLVLNHLASESPGQWLR